MQLFRNFCDLPIIILANSYVTTHVILARWTAMWSAFTSGKMPVLNMTQACQPPLHTAVPGLNFSSNQPEWFQQSNFSWPPDYILSLLQILAPSVSTSWKEFYSPSIILDPQSSLSTWQLLQKQGLLIASQLNTSPLVLNCNHVSKYVTSHVLCSVP